MKIMKIVVLLVLGLAISACSKTDQGDTGNMASDPQAAMEKAEGVEEMVQDADKKKREEAGMMTEDSASGEGDPAAAAESSESADSGDAPATP